MNTQSALSLILSLHVGKFNNKNYNEKIHLFIKIENKELLGADISCLAPTLALAF